MTQWVFVGNPELHWNVCVCWLGGGCMRACLRACVLECACVHARVSRPCFIPAAAASGPQLMFSGGSLVLSAELLIQSQTQIWGLCTCLNLGFPCLRPDSLLCARAYANFIPSCFQLSPALVFSGSRVPESWGLWAIAPPAPQTPSNPSWACGPRARPPPAEHCSPPLG